MTTLFSVMLCVPVFLTAANEKVDSKAESAKAKRYRIDLARVLTRAIAV
jgi:hypothetical protein